MPLGYVNDSKHWRDRAEEMRSLSLMMHHFDTASIVLAMAEDYDRLAEHASGNAPVTRTIAHCRGASPHGV
jgi:hypothetical protein